MQLVAGASSLGCNPAPILIPTTPLALEDYRFRVEELSPAGELIRVIAYLDHPIIARAAFQAAVEQYPKVRIRLRNRALVMEEHKPK